MDLTELATEIWNHPDSKQFVQQDWARWMTSGYHVTKRMDLDTLIESAYGMVDLGLPEFYEDWFFKTHPNEVSEGGDGYLSLVRTSYYKEAESAQVISILTKKLWDRTPRDLRPEPEPTDWLQDVKEWAKRFGLSS